MSKEAVDKKIEILTQLTALMEVQLSLQNKINKLHKELEKLDNV